MLTVTSSIPIKEGGKPSSTDAFAFQECQLYAGICMDNMVGCCQDPLPQNVLTPDGKS